MLWNSLLIAMVTIRRNVMRSFLTVLGIVIGVAAVITMVTVGAGATAQVTDEIASLGSKVLMVNPGQGPGPGSKAASPFDLDDAEAIRREIRGLDAVAPMAAQNTMAVYANNNWSTNATGIDQDFLEVRNWEIGRGCMFTDGEQRSGRAVCILGQTVVDELFGELDPIGAKIRLHKVAFQVVGVLEAKGQSVIGTDQDDVVLIPIRTFHRRISGNEDIHRIQVAMSDGATVEQVQADIEELMRKRRHISASEEDDFSVMDMEEIANMLTGTTRTMTALLGAVAAISLIVGGIGVMNIMLVSVTERTREIGIRLAIGALGREVLMQFLVESIVLSCFGGLIGITIAIVASLLLTNLMGVSYVFDLQIIIVAFLFSFGVGVVFGYLPARKAASLNPIEALRHE